MRMEIERKKILNARVSFGDESCTITIGNTVQTFSQNGDDTIQNWTEGIDVNNIQPENRKVHEKSNYDIVAMTYFHDLLEKALNRIQNLVVIMPIKRGFFDVNEGKQIVYPTKIQVKNLKVLKCKNVGSLESLLDCFYWQIDCLTIGVVDFFLSGIGSIEQVINAKTLRIGQTNISDDELAKLRSETMQIRPNNITENGIQRLMMRCFDDNDLVNIEICIPNDNLLSPEKICRELDIIETYRTSTQYETVDHFIVTIPSSRISMDVKFSGNKIMIESYAKLRRNQDKANWNFLPNEIKLEVIKHMSLVTRNCFRSCSKHDKILVDSVPFRLLRSVDIEFGPQWCKIEIDYDSVHKFTQIGEKLVQYERYELNKLISSNNVNCEPSLNTEIKDSYVLLAIDFLKPFLVQSSYFTEKLFFDLTIFPGFFESYGTPIKVRELTICKYRGAEKLATFLETIDSNLSLLRIGSEIFCPWIINESHMCTAKKLIHRVANIDNSLMSLKNDYFEIIASTYSEVDINLFLQKVLSGNYRNLTGFQFSISNNLLNDNKKIYEADLGILFNGIEAQEVPQTPKFDEYGEPRRFPPRRDFRSCYILKLPKSNEEPDEGEAIEKSSDVEIRAIFYNCFMAAVVKNQ